MSISDPLLMTWVKKPTDFLSFLENPCHFRS